MTDNMSGQFEFAAQAGQMHVVQAAEQLDEAGCARLASSLEAVPWDTLDELRGIVLNPPRGNPPFRT